MSLEQKGTGDETLSVLKTAAPVQPRIALAIEGAEKR